MLFPALFEQAVARTPERTAVADLQSGVEYSYTDLHERAAAVAAGLADRGVEPGDRIAICTANRPEHVATFLGTQFAGVVAVPFNFRLAPEGVRYHVRDADADLLFFDSVSGESVAAVAEDTDGNADTEMVYVGDDPPAFATPFEVLRGDPDDRPDAAIDDDDPSCMLYSSGTTGDPKGIPLSHEATATRVLSNSLGQRYYLGETMIGVMPLYHTIGLHGILCCLLGMSGTYLCMPQFDPELFVEAIEEHSVTALHEAPTIFQQLLATDAIETVDTDSVRAVGYSGAPMSQATFDRVLETFDPEHVANLYGTTEAFGTLAHVDLQGIGDPTVAGPANVGYEVRIVTIGAADPEAVVDEGEEGELIAHTDSPVSFEGYWNDPEATAAAIHDGWFFTGDIAKRTAEGNIVITGRVGDVIISGGENVHPATVEDVLAGHPAVLDVGVIGVPDEQWGERVTAVVVAEDDTTEEDLEEWCLDSETLADFMRPRAYEFVERVPRNPSGKIMRYELRERYGQ